MALKGVFRSQSGEAPTQHSFRVGRDSPAIGATPEWPFVAVRGGAVYQDGLTWSD